MVNLVVMIEQLKTFVIQCSTFIGRLHLRLGMTRMVIVNLGNPILVLFRELE